MDVATQAAYVTRGLADSLLVLFSARWRTSRGYQGVRARAGVSSTAGNCGPLAALTFEGSRQAKDVVWLLS